MRRNALLFVLISVCSGFGSYALALAAGLWILDLTGSPGLAALAGIGTYAPTLAAPWLGAVVDRFPGRPLLITVDMLVGAAILALLVVRSAGWIYPVLLMRGLSYVLLDAGESALLPAALPAVLLGHVNGWRSSAQEGMKLLAPLTGAALYAWRGPHAVILLCAVLPLLTAALYTMVRLPAAGRSPSSGVDAPAWPPAASAPADVQRHPRPSHNEDALVVTQVGEGSGAVPRSDESAVAGVRSGDGAVAGAWSDEGAVAGACSGEGALAGGQSGEGGVAGARSGEGALTGGQSGQGGVAGAWSGEGAAARGGVSPESPDRNGGRSVGLGWGSVRAGVEALWREPVRTPVVVAAVAIAVSGLTNAAVLSHLVEGLHRPSTQLGILSSVQGAGSIVGGFLVGRLLARLRAARVAALGAGLFAVACVAWSLPWWPAMLTGSALTGLGLPWTLIAGITAIQTGTPDHLLGRAAATGNMVMFGPITLAIPLGSALSQLGSRPPLLLGAGVVLAASLVATHRTRSAVPPAVSTWQ
ncbi:MFS transporter [Actinoplanes oblitus]|uniref:MFS transporter n=1 Tax=Actinoplanes oblitus TaxID=3040509 RepID=A0ABY8WL16_9ACTN|nr:MFS transporter [Actinoplanes oblitus]WIM98102.1 MFS transporter [Actinoplanes oblitus]